MQRLAALVYRRRRTVLGVWIAALAAAVAFIFIAGDALTPRQELPGSESVLAGKRLSTEFGIPRSEPIQLVLRASTPLAAQRPAVERLVAATRAAFPDRRIDSPFSSATGASAIGPSGLVGYVNIPFDDQLEAQDSVPLARRTVTATPLPFTVLVSGGPVVQLEMNPALRRDLVRAELVAGALSLIVLVVVLGSIVAGTVPLLLALFVIPIVLSIVFALSHVTDVTVFAPNVVTLVGLGIAIDYSLLVVYRFREELAAGRPVPAAVAATMRTAVRAVVFSGVTVGIGLGVLLLVRVPFVQSFGLAGILIPIVTILAALTLLPALMGMLGHRINRWRVVPVSVLAASESRPWRRIAEQIMRAPLVFLLVGGVVIGVAAAPVRDLALGSTPLAVYPDTGPGAQGVKLLAAEFGSGGVAPVRILVDRPVAEVERALPAIRAANGVRAAVLVPGPTGTLVNTFSDDEVGSAASNELVRHLRHTVLPALLPAGSYAVGGAPAVFYDFQQALYGDFTWIALIVVAATMLVLFRAFRSLLLPLKAVLMNGLSVAGAYGLLVAVFQHGIGADLVGFHRTEQIAVWIPLFLFAFLFGLSMDYEVFLLARMREEYDAVPDNTRAVAAGLAKTGKLITSAALIMVIAFCGLAASRFIEMQQFGFGLAAAVLLDATLIRALIVPSLMKLMGRGNWWLPAPLRPLAGRRSRDR
jgi:RND superfamily putative drug exporter